MKLKPYPRLYQLLWSGLDWLFPPHCGGCSAFGQRWCLNCQRNIVPLTQTICEICGGAQKQSGFCAACRREAPPYTALRSWAAFAGPLQNAVHRLKYRRDIGLGEALSRPLVDYYCTLKWQIDLVVPIPLGARRWTKRGYNQVALLAYPFALSLGIPYNPDALRRVRDTRSQVGLSLQERRQNVHGAFESQTRLVEGRTVLVVDDVTTTGSTIREGSQALINMGARDVYGLTLARAVYRESQREA